MKTFRMIGMALVAMMLSIGLSSCESDDDDDNFIPVDYSKDLVGTWTCLEPGFAEALVISADGTVVSTGVGEGEYWEGLKGTIEVENNKMELTFGEEDDFEGRFEMIPGEAFVIIEEGTGERITYRLCKQDLSREIVGMWVCLDSKLDIDNNMLITTYQEDGVALMTGYSPITGKYEINSPLNYHVIGDLLFQSVPDDSPTGLGGATLAIHMTYTSYESSVGDMMTNKYLFPVEGQYMETSMTHFRVKQNLDLAGKKYDFTKSYVTNVKGLDQDITFMDYTFNFSKMNSTGFNKFLKTVLFSVEFPDANTIKYSCMMSGTTVSMECPIEVDGNKITVKMSDRYAAYRDIDFYTFQDKDDSQLHMYMPTYTFENFFSNFQVGVMASQGMLDLDDTAAVEAIHQSIADAVETINVSFIMSNSK